MRSTRSLASSTWWPWSGCAAHDELGDVIPGRVNKVPGVTHTETHIAFRTYSRHDLEAAFAIGYDEA